LLALASYFPLETLVDDILRLPGGFAPPEVLQIISDQMRKISAGHSGGKGARRRPPKSRCLNQPMARPWLHLPDALPRALTTISANERV
jgi:hypothetical protein